VEKAVSWIRVREDGRYTRETKHHAPVVGSCWYYCASAIQKQRSGLGCGKREYLDAGGSLRGRSRARCPAPVLYSASGIRFSLTAAMFPRRSRSSLINQA